MRIFVQHTIIGIAINQMIYTLVQRADADMASWRIFAVLIWWIFQCFPFTGMFIGFLVIDLDVCISSCISSLKSVPHTALSREVSS